MILHLLLGLTTVALYLDWLMSEGKIAERFQEPVLAPVAVLGLSQAAGLPILPGSQPANPFFSVSSPNSP